MTERKFECHVCNDTRWIKEPNKSRGKYSYRPCICKPPWFLPVEGGGIRVSTPEDDDAEWFRMVAVKADALYIMEQSNAAHAKLWRESAEVNQKLIAAILRRDPTFDLQKMQWTDERK